MEPEAFERFVNNLPDNTILEFEWRGVKETVQKVSDTCRYVKGKQTKKKYTVLLNDAVIGFDSEKKNKTKYKYSYYIGISVNCQDSKYFLQKCPIDLSKTNIIYTLELEDYIISL